MYVLLITGMKYALMVYFPLSFTVNTPLIAGVTFGSVIAITIFTVFVIAMSSVYSRKRRMSFNK